ncbi:hypothetical protein OG535_38305 [Kitasatospora sp. NBC_00085]|uniref:hypothetical protein n=1 Tax=unclassified Kitasatospora TaxID=2633591 RepID=UPI003247CAE0
MQKIRTLAASAIACGALVLTAAPAQARPAAVPVAAAAVPVTAAAAVPAADEAARSTWVTVFNKTTKPLALAGNRLLHGCWMDNRTPQSWVNSRGAVMFASESCGFMTGTEGEVTYNINEGGQVHLTWNNPYSGANSYTCTVPSGYSCVYSGGSGNSAQVTFTFTKD